MPRLLSLLSLSRTPGLRFSLALYFVTDFFFSFVIFFLFWLLSIYFSCLFLLPWGSYNLFSICLERSFDMLFFTFFCYFFFFSLLLNALRRDGKNFLLFFSGYASSLTCKESVYKQVAVTILCTCSREALQFFPSFREHMPRKIFCASVFFSSLSRFVIVSKYLLFYNFTLVSSSTIAHSFVVFLFAFYFIF